MRLPLYHRPLSSKHVFAGIILVLFCVLTTVAGVVGWREFPTWLAILCSAIVASLAILAQFFVSERNRKVAAAFDLYREFYADTSFVKARLILWARLRKLAETQGISWDFYQWGTLLPIWVEDKSVSRGDSLQWSVANGSALKIGDRKVAVGSTLVAVANSLDTELFAILNKVATFYFRLRLLMEQEEVDGYLVSKLFAPNYMIWNRFRQLFYQQTTTPAWIELLEPIQEFQDIPNYLLLDVEQAAAGITPQPLLQPQLNTNA